MRRVSVCGGEVACEHVRICKSFVFLYILMLHCSDCS